MDETELELPAEILVHDEPCSFTAGLPRVNVSIRGECFTYRPQRDIKPYEIAKLIELFFGCMNAYADLEGWWDEAGPDIWRHFTSQGG